MGITLFEDDFASHPTGPFSADVGPLTEYHFLGEAAPQRGWSVAAFYHDETRMAWKIGPGSGDSGLAMVQAARNATAFVHPILCAGDAFWGDYEAAVTVRPLEVRGRCGILVHYETSRRHYFFGLVEAGARLLRVREELGFHEMDEEILARADFAWLPGRAYRLWVGLAGEVLNAEVRSCEGVAIVGTALATLSARDPSFPRGKIGLSADGPAEFTSVRVSASGASASRSRDSRRQAEEELGRLRAQNPKPMLWKKIATTGFGVGRNLRFGDLDGDGRTELLVPQVVQHGPRDAYAEVGCLTALDLDGRVLWRNGDPDPAHWFLTNDVAVQVHDIDGDGAAEVVYCRNQELVIAEGSTGRIKRRIPTPESDGNCDAFPRILGDCLFFCDVRGQGRAGDIVLKDRYWNFWVYDDELRLLWTATCNAGHYPTAADIDGDGKDELFMGYSLFDHDGRLLWCLDDRIAEHADGIMVADFMSPGKAPDRILYAASDDGVVIADLSGRILRHHHIGHAQNPATLKLRPDLPGLQTVTVNFWGSQGILSFFDASGELYHRAEPLNMGSMCLPVNWRGDGQEYFLLNTNPQHGGLFDGWARPVVTFPHDGHPDLCAAVLDLTSDCRDEILTWDAESIWIYTQDDAPKGTHFGKPLRNRHCNSSNYQASFSFPGRGTK